MKGGDAALSVVFSTRRLNPAFVRHLEATIGLDAAEILPYENPGIHTLAGLYNRGLREAAADYIVFIHDDIRFEQPGWGAALLSQLRQGRFGILGIAGSTDLVLRPDGTVRSWWWWRARAVGSISHEVDGVRHATHYSNRFDEPIPVVCIDGVLMAVDRRRLKRGFDERFRGFNFYDIPFSFANHLAGVPVGVTFGVRVTHFSTGTIDADHEYNRQQFSWLYGEHLPYGIAPARVRYEAAPIARFDPGSGLVSVIIPTKEHIDLLLDCIGSLLAHTHSARYEILIADTGSSPETKAELRRALAALRPPPNLRRIRLIEYNRYHFARINNHVVRHHLSPDSRYLLFCNNDIKLLNDALDRCLFRLRRGEHVGTLGIRLHYASNAVQHNGIRARFGQRRIVDFTHRHLNSYYRYDDGEVEVLGNSAAFMLMERALFESLRFNEGYSECFEDVELNLRLRLRGRRNLQLGHAVAYHYESQTRDLDPGKRARMLADYEQHLLPFFKTHCVGPFARQLRAAAQRALSEGRTTMAVELCRLVLQRFPRDADARRLLEQAETASSSPRQRL